MALSARSIIRNEESSTSPLFASWSPAAFTPAANSKLLAIVFMEATDDAGGAGTDITLSDTEGYFTTTKIAGTASPAGWQFGIAAFEGVVGASPASTTISVDCGTFEVRKFRVVVLQWTGADPAARQSQIGLSGTNTGAKSITLDSDPLATSDVVAALFYVNENFSAAVTPGSDFTELFDLREDGWDVAQMQARLSSTSATVGWDAAGGDGTAYGTVLLAVEIAEAGGGGGGGSDNPSADRRRRAQSNPTNLSF